MIRVENMRKIALAAIPLVLILAACSSGASPEQTVVVVTDAPAATELPVELPTAVPIAPTPASGDPTLIAKVNAAVRSGPDTNYPVYAFMSGGQAATLAGTNEAGTHYAIVVRVAASGTGWVDAQFADVRNAGDLAVIEPPPPPPSTSFQPPAPGEPAVIAQEAVTVRSGPGDAFPAYGVGEKGASAGVLGIDETLQWFAVRLNPEVIGKGHGWVRTGVVETEDVSPDDLIVIEAPPLPQPAEVPQPGTDDPQATAVDYVNVRTGPGSNYPVLVVAQPGATGGVAGQSADGHWWQVLVGEAYTPSGLAWVNTGYVTTKNTENVTVVEAPPPPAVVPPPSGLTACVLVSQSPADGSAVAQGKSFNMTWVVQNVSSQAWGENTTDVKFVSAAGGTRLSSTDLFDLSTSVPSGGTYTVSVPMTAPSSAGQYGETWSMNEGGTNLCQFYNLISVNP